MKHKLKRLTSCILTLALVIALFPVIPAQAAEILDGKIVPREGAYEVEFGFQTTQYVDINVYAKSVSDPAGAGIKYELAKDFWLTGVQDVPAWLPPPCGAGIGSGCRTPVTYQDDGLSIVELEPYTTEVNFAGEPIPATPMMKHKLIWDCTIDGFPVVGPNLDEDQFILEIEIVPQGRPDWSTDCTDGVDGNGDPIHTHGDDYTWPQDPAFIIRATTLVNYRQFIETDDGSLLPAFIFLKGGFSDKMVGLADYFFSGSMTCFDITQYPELAGLVMDYELLDPVDMVTGAYQATYIDLRLEGAIPLTFTRAYSSRYDSGSLGKGFTHSYDYTLREDRGMIRITMPGGDEQVFLSLSSSYSDDYKSLQSSEFTLHDDGSGGYIMKHINGAELLFNSSDQLAEIKNPDGVSFTLSYSSGYLTTIAGTAGSFALTWDTTNDVITQVSDSAGRSVVYEHSGDLLTSVTNPDGDTLYFAYDANGFLTESTDFENETYLINEYDDLGRVVLQEFKNAGKWLTATIAYDEVARINTCIDFFGREIEYHYDEDRNLIGIVDADGTTAGGYDNHAPNQITDKLGNTVGHTLDANDRPVQIDYPDSASVSIVRDTMGRITSITDGMGETEHWTYSGFKVMSYKDKNGNLTTYTYNSLGLPATVTNALSGITTYEYNAKGLLLWEEDAEGNRTSYGYDSVGRITSVTNPRGFKTEYVYSDAGKLELVTDALDNETSYEYNANGFTTLVTDALGEETRTVYASNGQITSVTDANGNETRYVYNSEGLLSSTFDPEDNETKYFYDDKGNVTRVEDAEENETHYYYDALNRLEKMVDALDGEVIYTYDEMGRRLSETDRWGNTTSYTYDLVGRTATTRNALGKVIEYGYDPNGNLTSLKDPDGVYTYNTYDALNRPATAKDGESNVTAYTYDAIGNITFVKDALTQTIAYEYDENSNLVLVRDASGYETKYVYDELDRCVTQINADGTTQTFVYDELSRLTESRNQLGYLTAYSYDAVGNMLTMTDPNGNITKYTYNGNNQTDIILYPDSGSVRYFYNSLNQISKYIDQMGNETTYEYDKLGRTSSVTDGAGTVTTYSYDSSRNITQTSKDGNPVQTQTYDALNRISAVTQYYAGGTSAQSGYTYGNAGQLLKYTDFNGNATAYTYDKNYQVTEVENMLGSTPVVSKTVYDAVGRVISGMDAEGKTTAYAYYPNGWTKSVTDADGNPVDYTYDQMGRPIELNDRRGNSTFYAYFDDGATKSITDALGSSSQYEYDKNGNLTKYTNFNNEWVSYNYDSMNRRVKETTQLNHSRTWEYYLSGAVKTYSDASRNETSYEYDGVHRLTKKTDAEGRALTAVYDYLNNPLTITTIGGTGAPAVTTYSYDPSGNVLKERSPLGNETSYTYDFMGNPLTKTDENSITTTYEYDELYRLVEATNSDGVSEYAYDKVGNILSATNGNGSVSFAYDDLHRLSKTTNEDATITTYIYDENSNIIETLYRDGSPDKKSVGVTYDALNNPIKLFDDGIEQVLYTRDDQGRITRENFLDGSTTEYGYNNEGQLVSRIETTPSHSNRREISYTYYENGNLRSEMRTGVDITLDDMVIWYYYDRADQLIETKQNGVSVNYTYDKAGNLLTDGRNTYPTTCKTN